MSGQAFADPPGQPWYVSTDPSGQKSAQSAQNMYPPSYGSQPNYGYTGNTGASFEDGEPPLLEGKWRSFDY